MPERKYDMNYLFFAGAVLLVTVGHFFRTSRWKSLISVYEETSSETLLVSMGCGYLTDMFLPFHLGDLVKAVYTGKKLKNQTAFSLATIFIDRLLDVAIVALLYGYFYFFQEKSAFSNFLIYTAGTLVLLCLLFWAMTFSKPVKKAVLWFSSVFNEKIQLWLLCFGWSGICTFWNILHKMSKPLLLGRTCCMWLCYLLSYMLFGVSIGDNNILSLFNTMFAPTSVSLFLQVLSGTQLSYFVLIYHAATCLCLFLLAFLFRHLQKSTQKREPELIIPYTNQNSRLDFLKIYFSDVRDKQEINAFLAVNKDVTILRNCSAGSNATTLLCIRNDEMLFRKYAFGADGEKLYAQVQWLQKNAENLSVTEIRHVERQEQFCCYDMPYLSNSVGFFDFVHSAPPKQVWNVLLSVLQDLEQNYSAHRTAKADSRTISEYVNAKVLGNLKKLSGSAQLTQLMTYDILVINGVSYKNLSFYLPELSSAEFWNAVFQHDDYSDIHGDLTIENIIYNSSYPKKYYLIDPNGGNLHNSPNLDYAKLLQSLHGSYEFLMHTTKVTVSENQISFRMTRSAAYDVLYQNLRTYLFQNFSRERVQSIYFHEIIHWLRLMPYKINHDSQRAALFYAGMMVVIHDIWEEFQL